MATWKRLVGRTLGSRPFRAPALAALAPVLHRWPNLPIVSGAAFYLAESLPTQRYVTVAKLRTGSRMLVDLTDHAQRPMFFQGEWEVGTTRLLQRRARTAWTFVDVGANAGYFSLLARDLGGPNARVLSFEPAPRARQLLEASVALNGAENSIIVRPEACGASGGTARLHLSTAVNSGESTLLEYLEAVEETVEVVVTTVDDVCEALSLAPDVVKVDAEGYEPEVVAGMRRLLHRRVPRLVLLEVSTYPGRPDPLILTEMMSEFGYEAHQITNDGELTPVERVCLAGFENIAFIPG